MATSRRRHILTVVAALGGVALFAFSVRQAGAGQILSGIRRVGWGLLPILGLAGLRFVLRAEAWRLCTPLGSRLRLRQAFMAYLAGDALGNVTPLGLIASEPTKVFLTRRHLATREAVSSLAIDNLVYASSVIVMVSTGLIVMLATVPLPFEIQEWSIATLAVLLAACLGTWCVFRWRRGPVRGPQPAWVERLMTLRSSVMEFSSGHPSRLWRAFALDVLFHVAAIVEALLTLRWLLGDQSPSLAQAMMFESLNRVITTAFKFVPLRVGVDEAASGAFAMLVGVNPVMGVSLAVVRKVRSLFWVATGLTFIAVYHAREAPAASRHGSVPAHRS